MVGRGFDLGIGIGIWEGNGLGLLIYKRKGRERVCVEPTVNKIKSWFGSVWIWKHGNGTYPVGVSC